MSHQETRKEVGKQMFLHLGQMFYDNSALIAVTRTYSNWKMLWYFTRGKKKKKKTHHILNDCMNTDFHTIVLYCLCLQKGTEQ